MRKSKNFINKIFSFIIAIFMFAIFFESKIISNNKTAFAEANQESEIMSVSSRSTFIHSPTYSIIYHNKVFFFDDYDNLLKVYDLQKLDLEETTLSLNSLGTVIDVSYYGEYVFVLSETYDDQAINTNISIINLSDFSIKKTIKLDIINAEYKRISICETDDNWLISLTQESGQQETIYPIVLTLNKISLEITNYCTIQIDDSILDNLFDLSIIKSAGTNENDIYLVLTFKETIYFFGINYENVTIEDIAIIDTSKSSLYESLDTTNANVDIADINTIVVDNNLMFLITYYSTDADGIKVTGIYSNLYSYAIDVTDEQKSFKSVLRLANYGKEYITTANSCILYPLQNEQQIVYTEISYNLENQKYSDTTPFPYIKNPNVEISYYAESEFKYVSANKTTQLLVTTPWALGNESNIEIVESKDLIVIGKGKILGENAIIDGFDYCMITTSDKNIKGFVKSQDLTLKEKITVDNYEYKVFKVQPNTNLYSLPSTIEEFRLIGTLNSNIISTIKENSKVELIDAICRYKSNEKTMLKVIVNDSEVGYIEYDRIIQPSDKNHFVITNASIKSDDTEIHLNSDKSSPIICKLNKGYRVRINGPRNTETGYTSVTFNDEYGNEFTGYILTDSIGSDSWTTMQIIGCILIAINVGLLILILKFKNKNIGNDGSKFIENQKINTNKS